MKFGKYRYTSDIYYIMYRNFKKINAVLFNY